MRPRKPGAASSASSRPNSGSASTTADVKRAWAFAARPRHRRGRLRRSCPRYRAAVSPGCRPSGAGCERRRRSGRCGATGTVTAAPPARCPRARRFPALGRPGAAPDRPPPEDRRPRRSTPRAPSARRRARLPAPVPPRTPPSRRAAGSCPDARPVNARQATTQKGSPATLRRRRRRRAHTRVPRRRQAPVIAAALCLSAPIPGRPPSAAV